MKQTAVEWFYQRILSKDIKAVFDQAKEMEKEQIFDAYITSHISMMSADQYYYETFKNKKMKQIVYRDSLLTKKLDK